MSSRSILMQSLLQGTIEGHLLNEVEEVHRPQISGIQNYVLLSLGLYTTAAETYQTP